MTELLLYNIYIRLYPAAVKIASFFNEKAKLWVNGRKYIFKDLREKLSGDERKKIWVHCASLGEFEQGRPLMEMLKDQYPSSSLQLSFFSPSGYEFQKHYKGADNIFYLPMDSKKNARAFLDLVNPSLVVFVKYELWYYYLQECKNRSIPVLLISAQFIKSMSYFQWYGNLQRKMLTLFSVIFVQNKTSAELLQSINIQHYQLCGDTRFDRVIEVAEQEPLFPLVQQFCGNYKTIVAGSTWREDDLELDHFVNTEKDVRFIIAPHDINADRIKECLQLYTNAILYSEAELSNRINSSVNALIIDNIGTLKFLYRFGDICYVGGGFGGDGIHNILEAAVYYKPVIFGPTNQKSAEAAELIKRGGAIEVTSAIELEEQFYNLLRNEEECRTAGKIAGTYVKEKTGATEAIMSFIQEKRLLTI